MTTSVAENRAKSGKQAEPQRARKKARKLPPGQRLLGYIAVAGVLLLVQSGAIPFGAALKSFNSRDKETLVAESAVLPPPINLKTPLDQLKVKLEQASAIKDLHAGVFVADTATGRYVDMNGHESFPAASMIKLPIFVALLMAVDAGRINPDQMLEIRQDLITGGSGWLQWRPVGTKMSVRDTADLMIIVSDNTATNMLIDLLGGKEALSAQFAQWGLASTRINNMLGDFEGTNTTSPYDLVYLLARIDRGEFLSPQSRQWFNATMTKTRIRTLLPAGLAPGSKIAHKTGDIGIMVGDAGTVTTPEGRKYFVSVQVRRPFNDRHANLLIRSLSKMIYPVFSDPNGDGSLAEVVPLETPAAGPVHHRATRHRRHHR